MIEDGLLTLVMVGLMLIVWAIAKAFFKDDVISMIQIMLLLSVLNMARENGNPDLYFTFGFCRKKYYKEQVILGLFRSIWFGIFQTIHWLVCYDAYDGVWYYCGNLRGVVCAWKEEVYAEISLRA